MVERGEDLIYSSLEMMDGAVNYLKWIADCLGGNLGDRVIEIGAGLGGLTQYLLQKELVVAVDTYHRYVEYLREHYSAYENIVVEEIDVTDPAILGLASYRADSVVSINVLEHIEEDVLALRHMCGLLGKGGRLALLVPAMPALYGSFDASVGHYRRYGRKDLSLKLSEAGFTVKKMFYMNAVAVPGWFLNYRVLGKKVVPAGQARLFDRLVVPWLRPLEEAVRPPFGLSLVALCEKR
jgi:SAM-dependent methyltransferase